MVYDKMIDSSFIRQCLRFKKKPTFDRVKGKGGLESINGNLSLEDMM